jgi:cytochrome c oxidase assembly protein subunit 15
VSALPAAALRPVPARVVTRIALVNVVVNVLIIVTGGAVRLTDSGLGCPTWPQCTPGSLVPTQKLGVYGVIEFSNRMLTPVVSVVAVVTLLAVWRSARRDLRRLAVTSFLFIPAQAVLGGISVRTGLNPWVVAAHFLLSSVLVAIATTLWLRSREPGVGELVVRPAMAGLARGIAGAVGAVIVVGTVVTGSGPHSGADNAARTGLDPEQMSQLHADLVFLLVGLTVAMLVALVATDAPRRVRGAARDLLVVELAQGLVGFVQYFTHLPIVLVMVHMLGAGVLTVGTARLLWSVRGPASDQPLEIAEPPATAVRQGVPGGR